MRNGDFFRKLQKNRFFYLMLLPIAAYFILFNYYPLALGIHSSFFNVRLIGDATFVGLENYQTVTESFLYRQAFANTLIVGTLTLVFQFVWGLVLALLLNEIRNKVLKSFTQSITYLPYLLSWSVVGGIWVAALSPSGLINGLLELLAGGNFRPITFMAEPSMARTIMVFTGAWRKAGYYSVLFLASIVSIDPTVYEAASIDGASRIKQILSITIPTIAPTMKVVAVLGTMELLRNFDQIFVMGNSSTFDKVRNLLYLIYIEGITKFKIGPATAAATVVLAATLVLSFIVRKLVRYDESYN